MNYQTRLVLAKNGNVFVEQFISGSPDLEVLPSKDWYTVTNWWPVSRIANGIGNYSHHFDLNKPIPVVAKPVITTETVNIVELVNGKNGVLIGQAKRTKTVNSKTGNIKYTDWTFVTNNHNIHMSNPVLNSHKDSLLPPNPENEWTVGMITGTLTDGQNIIIPVNEKPDVVTNELVQVEETINGGIPTKVGTVSRTKTINAKTGNIKYTDWKLLSNNQLLHIAGLSLIPNKNTLVTPAANTGWTVSKFKGRLVNGQKITIPIKEVINPKVHIVLYYYSNKKNHYQKIKIGNSINGVVDTLNNKFIWDYTNSMNFKSKYLVSVNPITINNKKVYSLVISIIDTKQKLQ